MEKPAEPPPPPARAVFYWDDVGGPPITARVDSHPAVLGRIRQTPNDDLVIVAVDPSDLHEHWRSVPLGTYSQGYQAVRYAVSGSGAAISDFRSTLHLLDLDTGKETKALQMSDRAKRLCPGETPGSVWVEQVDARRLLVDLASGSTTEAPKEPSTCPKDHRMRPIYPGQPRTTPTVPGFEARGEPAVSGGQAVAVMAKSPGTPIPSLFGFDPKTLVVRWQTLLPVMDPNLIRNEATWSAIADGGYYVVYGEGADTWHLAAFDVTAGVRRWDVTLKPIFSVDSISSVMAADGYVYVARTSSLDVYAALDGRRVGAIGDETYDDE